LQYSLTTFLKGSRWFCGHGSSSFFSQPAISSARVQRQRQRESERLCGLEIDDQLKLGGLYDRHVGAAKNFFMKPKAAAAAHGQRLATTPQRRRLANTFVARKGQSGAT
jgi:hypothetical protein